MSPGRIMLAFLVSFVMFGCSAARPRTSFPPFPLAETDRNVASSVRINVDGHRHGSGTIIAFPNGCVILTSEHVVRGVADTAVTVTLQNADGIDETRPAEVLRRDPARDLALVWTRRCGRGYRAVLAEDDEVTAGAYVYSIGFPGDRIRETNRGRIRKTPFFVHMRPAELADFNDGILADMAGEAGASGAGVYSAKTGKLVGVHKMSFSADDGERSVIVSVKEIRRLIIEYGLDME